ncbi:MAG: aldo/keto reductase [Chloroflexi bacterium]|nr:aldo/keto reductase [Chloroflexota bacterium]
MQNDVPSITQTAGAGWRRKALVKINGVVSAPGVSEPPPGHPALRQVVYGRQRGELGGRNRRLLGTDDFSPISPLRGFMIISGRATKERTRNYSQRHPAIAFNPLGETGLVASQAGFGGYRIADEDETHRAALRYALQNGVNLVDTSSNYADGGSERLIGQVIAELSERGELEREEIVVVSKVGYLQGKNYLLAAQRKREGRPFPNIVKYAQGLDHCIHPEFLADQLTRSLERLNLDCIDVYLLHNPEYYLSWADRVGIPLAEARKEYYRRIGMAFEHLEKEVENGRIQCYGVSSNAFPAPAADPKFTSLATVWEIAEEIGRGLARINADKESAHHFRVIQLPLNLLETGTATEKNQLDGRMTLAWAREKNLAVLVNRPLNAIKNDALTRLADVPPPSYPTNPGEVSTAVDSCRQLEERFHVEFLPHIDADEETKKRLQEYLAVGLMLHGRWASFGAYHNWRDVRGQFLLPRLQNGIQFLANQLESAPELTEWINRYVDAANEVLAAVSAFYQAQAAAQGEAMMGTAVLANPDWRADTLSQTAVRALRSTAGIASVLVGMRRQAYVDNILAELKRPVAVDEQSGAWENLKRKT